MFLKVSGVFLAAVVGWWGRDVSGVATKRRAALGASSVRGERGQKVNETVGLALGERQKLKASFCGPWNCPGWAKDGDHYTVPYYLDRAGPKYSPQQLAELKWVVDYFGRYSNLKFVEQGGVGPETGKYLHVYKLDYLFCDVADYTWGNNDFVQVSLSDSCFTTGSVAGTLMRAVGFYFEHQRPDRDDYVIVQNICDYMPSDKNADIEFSTPYDMASVLQLPPSNKFYTCPKDNVTVSFVAKDTTLQPVLEADKMAPSTCDLALLSERYPGPVKGPTCVPHELPAVCAPVDDCKDILGTDEAGCRDQCKLKCQHNIAPAAEKPACKLLSLEEMSSSRQTSQATSQASSPHRAAHLPAVVLLGTAVGVAFPLSVR